MKLIKLDFYLVLENCYVFPMMICKMNLKFQNAHDEKNIITKFSGNLLFYFLNGITISIQIKIKNELENEIYANVL